MHGSRTIFVLRIGFLIGLINGANASDTKMVLVGKEMKKVRDEKK